jgi:hypothetical protein
MNELQIISAIKSEVGSNPYSYWTIGITDDCARRRREHEAEGANCKYWCDWLADTEAIARSVETYFLDRGMKGGRGGGEHPTYVYIY